MPKFYSSSYIIRILMKEGFIFISQRGSHMKFRKISSSILTVIVPANKKEIPQGTLRSILRQSNLNEENFD